MQYSTYRYITKEAKKDYWDRFWHGAGIAGGLATEGTVFGKYLNRAGDYISDKATQARDWATGQLMKGVKSQIFTPEGIKTLAGAGTILALPNLMTSFLSGGKQQPQTSSLKGQKPQSSFEDLAKRNRERLAQGFRSLRR